MSKEQFITDINNNYTTKGDYILLGAAVLDSECISNALIKAPLKTMNRHGLIAGATGTGKTKSLQMIAESLSEKGVSCLMMDIKGDLSGIAMPGNLNEKITERSTKTGISWNSLQLPVELLTISDEKGVRLRATVSEFGPVLFSKILELNDTQQGVVSLLFKYCDDKNMPLLDLKDFKKVLQYLINEGKEEIKATYGSISTSSASTILRKIIEIEQQGAERLFGELSFDVNDLIKLNDNGYGQLNVLRLSDMQSKPKLFSTFMLCLLAEIYATFPEEGDADQPKLCIFVDEAHLIFDSATKTLLDQIETIIKLIRSKGVGVFFITQLPTDIPASILSQLGLKVQHALRAFTANDRTAIDKAARNFPETDYYKTEELLTQLGIGEALVTVLSEKGTPSPLVHTMMRSPRTRMDILTTSEIDNIVSKSPLSKKYNEEVDRESAYEILTKKLTESAQQDEEEKPLKSSTKKEKEEPSVIEKAINSSAGKQVMRTAASILTRSLLGVLGVSSSSKRSKKSSWF